MKGEIAEIGHAQSPTGMNQVAIHCTYSTLKRRDKNKDTAQKQKQKNTQNGEEKKEGFLHATKINSNN